MNPTEAELAEALSDLCDALEPVLRLVRLGPDVDAAFDHAKSVLANYAQPLNPS